MSDLEQITGTFNRVFAAFENGDARTVVAGIGRNGDGDATIKGRDDDYDLIPGSRYEFWGRWVEHHKHGQQFEFKQFRESEPHSRQEIITYLQRKLRGTGVGIGIITKLWDAFEDDTIRVLRDNPERACQAVPQYLKPGVAANASGVLAENQKLADVEMRLISLFGGRGFPHSLPKQVIKQWGILAVDRVRRDPFSLLVEGFSGCGFLRCDRLYMDLGLNPARLKRQMICIWHKLHSDTSGHTWHKIRIAHKALAEHMSGAKPDAKRAIELGRRADWLSLRKDREGQWWIAESKNAIHEYLLANKLKELIKCK